LVIWICGVIMTNDPFVCLPRTHLFVTTLRLIPPGALRAGPGLSAE
jgi:hypothetical protein